MPTTEGIEGVGRTRPAPTDTEFTPVQALETPVFVSGSDRRAKLLLAIGTGIAGFVVLWLAALLAGAFGLRGLPIVPVPRIAGGDHVQAGPAPGRESRSGGPERRLQSGDSRPVGHGASALSPTGSGGGSARRLFDRTGSGFSLPNRRPASGKAPSGGQPAPGAAPQPQSPTSSGGSQNLSSSAGGGGTARGGSKPAYTPSGKTVPTGPGTAPSSGGLPSTLPDKSQATARGTTGP